MLCCPMSPLYASGSNNRYVSTVLTGLAQKVPWTFVVFRSLLLITASEEAIKYAKDELGPQSVMTLSPPAHFGPKPVAVEGTQHFAGSNPGVKKNSSQLL